MILDPVEFAPHDRLNASERPPVSLRLPAVLVLVLAASTSLPAEDAPQADPAAGAVAWPALKPSVGTARRSDTAVLFDVPADAKGVLSFPRLDNQIGKAYWLGHSQKPLKFKQTPTTWNITIDRAPTGESLPIVLETVGRPYLATEPWVEKPDDAGIVRLHAHHAGVHGEKLQYEPLPHKNTVGFWVNADDWAEWTFDAPAGKYVVRILQGCGRGQGGSDARITVGEQRIDFVVEDTGHFQEFKWRTLGTFEVAAGEQELTLRAVKKAKAAVMDCRRIELVPEPIAEEYLKTAPKGEPRPGR